MTKLTITQKRKKMNQVLNKLVSLITHNPEKLLKENYFNNKKGHHCIIGHYLSKEDIKKIKEEEITSSDINGIWYYIETKKIKELPLSFWEVIQCLNDNHWEIIWNKKGLTAKGKERVEELRKNINKPFTFWVGNNKD